MRQTFVFSLSLFFTLFAHAEFRSTGEALKKLKNYKPTFYAEVHDTDAREQESGKKAARSGLTAGAEKKLNQFYKDMNSAIALEKKSQIWDFKLLDEILRLTSLSLHNDASQSMADSVVPLYQKDPKVFMDHVKQQPPDDAKMLEDAVKNADSIEKHGNG